MCPRVCKQVIVYGHGVLSRPPFPVCEGTFDNVAYDGLNQEMRVFVHIFLKYDEVDKFSVFFTMLSRSGKDWKCLAFFIMSLCKNLPIMWADTCAEDQTDWHA